MTVSRIFLVTLALAACSVACRAGDSAVGRKVQEFSLANCYGKSVALSEYKGKFVIVAFLGTECPLAKLYGPRLNAIQSEFGDRDVAVLGVNSNKQDSITELAAYVHRHKISFPMLKDVGNQLADQLGARRTPEVFLLDRDRVVRYHGRIDDQYGVGYSRDKTVKRELVVAIEELLAGKRVSTAETEAVGCHIGKVKKQAPTGEVTFSKHIAPILNTRCVSCHREGEIAPFTLTRYEDVLGWEDTILEVIEENRMPPWSADPKHGKFSNDARLSEEEKDLIFAWVENGMPEGNAEDLPTPPSFVSGWRIPKPDEVIEMRGRPFDVPAEGLVDYQHFVVDPGWTTDKYVYATEARPENYSVVHHILVYIVPPGKKPSATLKRVLAGYAPGASPMNYGKEIAIHVEAGSKLLFELHYTPNGTKQTDLSSVGVCFTEESDVKNLLHGRIAIDHEFEIPPNESDHEVKASYRTKKDEMLLSMTPHMHLRGKSFRYEAIYPDGKRETLLSVPRYDFNWQLKYLLEQPKRIPRGTEILCTAIFDNSEANLSNPDPSKTVRWGDQSFDEMMIGFMTTIDAD